MRSYLTAVPAGRAERLLSLFDEIESAAGEISAGEALEAVGRAARLEALLRARYVTLSASAAAPPSTPAAEGSRYLSASAAADYLGVSRATVIRLQKAGKLTPRRPSEGTVRFDREDLDAYMNAR